MARVRHPPADVGRDESALHEAEVALERARASLRSILEASREIVLLHTRGVITFANDAAVAALGYSGRAELVGLTFLDVVDAGDREAVQRLSAIGDDSVGVAAPAPRRIGLRCRDGSTRATEAAAMPVVFDGALATAVLAVGVADRERTLTRLAQANRLAVLSALCAGAAHEINNPLTSTLLNIEHILRTLRALPSGSGALTREQIDEMIASLSRSMDGATRVSEVGRTLTLLARGGGAERRSVVETGWGPSISHGLIRPLGGDITVETTLGAGSTRLLVVDGEELVGDAIVRALATECKVTHAASGREALALFSAGATYDVVLCDVTISDLSVVDLYAEAVRVAPALRGRFVFMTGGAFTPEALAFVESVGGPCLEKPLRLHELREIVGRCPAPVL